MASPLFPAYQLEPATYKHIERSMLAVSPSRPGAALRLPKGITPGAAKLGPDQQDADRSLTRQLHQVLSGTLSDGRPPDAYLLTSTSALPVADSLRHFFAAAPAMPRPRLLGYIKANKRLADEYWHGDEWAPLEINDTAEVERLRSVTSGCAHICVVEQFVSSGATLAYAGRLLLGAGAQMVTAIRGNWYEDATLSEYEEKHLTSVHQEFMGCVGTVAAAGVQTYSEHFANAR